MAVPTTVVGILHEGVFRTYVDLLNKRKKKAGVPNALIREINSLHDNTSLEDLDKDFKADISELSKALLAYINKNGFSVVPKTLH